MVWDKSGVAADFAGAFMGGAVFGHHIGILCLNNAGEVESAVVYHDWQPKEGRIEMSVAAKTSRWITRARVREIFDYPFKILGVDIIHGKTKNPRIVRIFRALGGNIHEVPGLYTVVTLNAEQWAKVRKERLEHGRIS